MSLQVGEFSSETGEMLEEGQIFRLDLDEAKGDNKRVMLPHPEIIEASEVGHTLLVDDGKVKLRVSGKVSLSREALGKKIPFSFFNKRADIFDSLVFVCFFIYLILIL